ncbi:helix-turn-helix domain-containing protein [Parafilimonas sp.]|jgi:transcriptional regulator with XRE-family HTH domain|uniref:helix-turn-helix domain-containing protein n=1 Tax=Parafilimonas sp. TaxID=1969739 RepID=UPI003F7FB02C
MQVGKAIKEIRRSKNLKQTVIADCIGISHTAYSDIERGKTSHITLQRLEQIATALDVSIITIILTAIG